MLEVKDILLDLSGEYLEPAEGGVSGCRVSRMCKVGLRRPETSYLRVVR